MENCFCMYCMWPQKFLHKFQTRLLITLFFQIIYLFISNAFTRRVAKYLICKITRKIGHCIAFMLLVKYISAVLPVLIQCRKSCLCFLVISASVVVFKLSQMKILSDVSP